MVAPAMLAECDILFSAKEMSMQLSDISFLVSAIYALTPHREKAATI